MRIRCDIHLLQLLRYKAVRCLTTTYERPLLLHFLPSQWAETELQTSTTLTFDGGIWEGQLAPGPGPRQISSNHSWIIHISTLGFFTAVERAGWKAEKTPDSQWMGALWREGGLHTARPLKAHNFSTFPAFWWSLKHAHADTTVTPNTHSRTQTHTACSLEFERALGQSKSSDTFLSCYNRTPETHGPPLLLSTLWTAWLSITSCVSQQPSHLDSTHWCATLSLDFPFLANFLLFSFDPAPTLLSSPVPSCLQVGQSQAYYPPCKRAAQQAGNCSPSWLHVSSRQKRFFMWQQHCCSRQNFTINSNHSLISEVADTLNWSYFYGKAKDYSWWMWIIFQNKSSTGNQGEGTCLTMCSMFEAVG